MTLEYSSMTDLHMGNYSPASASIALIFGTYNYWPLNPWLWLGSVYPSTVHCMLLSTFKICTVARPFSWLVETLEYTSLVSPFLLTS